jgi:hypothetical protein
MESIYMSRLVTRLARPIARSLHTISGGTTSDPSLWRLAAARVELKKLLPPSCADVRVSVFFGDKLLSAAVASALQRTRGAQPDLRDLSNMHFLVTDKAFLLTHLDRILPDHADEFPRDLPNPADRARAMVQAAVAEVHAADGSAAVTELGEWLVAKVLHAMFAQSTHVSLPQNGVAGQHLPDGAEAIRTTTSSVAAATHASELGELQAGGPTDAAAPYFPTNAKDRVLELGGTVNCDRRGGTDDAPLFNAVAELNGEYLAIKGGRSKDEAEQLVSERLLTAILNPGYSLAARTAINRERGVSGEGGMRLFTPPTGKSVGA